MGRRRLSRARDSAIYKCGFECPEIVSVKRKDTSQEKHLLREEMTEGLCEYAYGRTSVEYHSITPCWSNMSVQRLKSKAAWTVSILHLPICLSVYWLDVCRLLSVVSCCWFLSLLLMLFLSSSLSSSCRRYRRPSSVGSEIPHGTNTTQSSRNQQHSFLHWSTPGIRVYLV